MSTATTSASPVSRAGTGRDGFLDLVRALALVRVVLWHASGWPVVTVVAAIPAMFFVSGTLFAVPAERGAARVVLDRVRRLLPPLWLFAAVSWTVMAVAATVTGTELRWGRLVWWLLPLGDPAGSEWEGGWLSSPLWYLRALLWVLLLAPVLIRAARRAPWSTVAVLGAVVLAGHAGQGAGWLRPWWHERLLWHVGDVALYGLFFVLGTRHRAGALDGVSRRQWLGFAGVAAGAATLWWWAFGPASGVVNDAQPLHLLVGLAWLCAALAAQQPLRRLAGHRLVRVPVRFLGQRSLSVYLWHAPALALGLAVTRQVGMHDVRWIGRYAVLSVLIAAVAVLAFGWAEDLGARRRLRWWPGPAGGPSVRPLALTGMAAVMAVVAVVLVVPAPWAADGQRSAVASFVPRAPSQAPPLPVVYNEAADVSWAGAVPFDHLDESSLARVTEAWRDHYGIAGVSLAVARPDGSTVTTATGRHIGGEPRRIDDPIDIMSGTKLFTANLVYRQVDAGLIDLDAPLPPLAALPDLPLAGRVTVRQLLSHRSGLINYRDLPRYQESPAAVVGPAEALVLSTTDVVWEGPTAEGRYSSTNFIVLGYLLEQVTGRSYDALLREELLEPLGLARTSHLPSEPGEPRFATAGIVGDLDDLGRATLALLRDHVGISEASLRVMTTIDPEAAMGAGTMSYCPCAGPGPDDIEAFAVGYTGGTTWLAYVPRHDVAFVVDVTGGVHNDQWGPVEALMQFVAEHSGSIPA